MAQVSDFRVLSSSDLKSLEVDNSMLIDTLTDAFHQKAHGKVQNPAKPKVAPRDGSFFNAMPAYLGGSDLVGIKWVSGYAKNKERDLPYIYGSMILNDADTGRPRALLDGGYLTDIRTPAVSGVVLTHAGREPRSCAILGAGVQAAGHLKVIEDIAPSVREVAVFDRRDERSQQLLDRFPHFEGRVASSARDAVTNADLVISTLTRPLDEKLELSDLADNALLIPIDYDDALAAEVMNESAAFLVDDIDQWKAVRDKGEYFQGVRDPDGELGQLVGGELTLPADGRLCFVNCGIAMADVCLADYFLRQAEATGAGVVVEFD